MKLKLGVLFESSGLMRYVDLDVTLKIGKVAVNIYASIFG